MENANVLLMVHGMVVDRQKRDHGREYDALWTKIKDAGQRLGKPLPATLDGNLIKVEYLHEAPNDDPAVLRPDQLLRNAENFSQDQVSIGKIKSNPEPSDHLRSGWRRPWNWLSRLALRPILRRIKEDVAILGLADVAYYCSADGEAAVRRAVYDQALLGMSKHEDSEHLRLHVIGQSLGVTVAFDFLFGLFAPDEMWADRVEEPGAPILPDYVRESQAENLELAEKYLFWRDRVKDGTLELGSFCSTASQLPLTMLRKQAVVDLLSKGKKLNPDLIGVPQQGDVRWKIFYDQDDVLGFPTRRLFEATNTIHDYEVNVGWLPDGAHDGYWGDTEVAEEIARLIHNRLA